MRKQPTKQNERAVLINNAIHFWATLQTGTEYQFKNPLEIVFKHFINILFNLVFVYKWLYALVVEINVATTKLLMKGAY